MKNDPVVIRAYLGEE
ncbi:MAG: hypothetical protein LBC90_08280 [Candidatus Adiutrix sp.]|nr:hypothetical protein [Candidatus Adiutrix sp.]